MPFNIDDIPRALSITTLELPSHSTREVKISELPENWWAAPIPSSTQEYATAFLQKAEFLALKIPSTIIHEEFNCIINPKHKDIGVVSIVDVKDFVFDVRIKSN